jgi:hypothetical protein
VRTVAFGKRRVIRRCRVRRWARVAAGKRHLAGTVAGTVAVRRRPAEVSGMSRLWDRYPWLPGGSALTLIGGWSRRLAAMS